MTEYYFIVMTISKPFPEGGGWNQPTFFGVATPEQAGRTRAEMFAWARGQFPEHMRDGSVVFFSAEANVLPVQQTGYER